MASRVTAAIRPAVHSRGNGGTLFAPLSVRSLKESACTECVTGWGLQPSTALQAEKMGRSPLRVSVTCPEETSNSGSETTRQEGKRDSSIRSREVSASAGPEDLEEVLLSSKSSPVRCPGRFACSFLRKVPFSRRRLPLFELLSTAGRFSDHGSGRSWHAAIRTAARRPSERFSRAVKPAR